ncbi:glycoside hydrolase family 16 protein [Sphingobacteriales bacterium UPWRP_1]|nr:glycosyl hydrolase family 16 [Sphingobacteriales bacterium TSM_CSM]PSJ76123.1 glycoside hydrolase family 16 protein [Sphingobacteriales bacterium UPWRP_1]
MKSNYKLKVIQAVFTISLLSLMLAGCKPDDFQKLEPRNWQLVWSDEFNGEEGAMPDSLKWTYDTGRGIDGWGNQELQYYTDRPQNVAMDGEGNLVLTAIKESYAGAAFTSARIKTQGLFTQTYGRFEAKLKTPFGPGLWPAFWMVGANIETVSWPQCGEIDIMELRGQQPNIINGSVHGPGYSGGNAITKGYGLQNERFDNQYHLFAVEWFPDRIDFFVDDYLYQRIEPEDVSGEWVYNTPFFMILNVAVGGNYVGFPTEQTPFPQHMVIDYVRVYQEAD